MASRDGESDSDSSNDDLYCISAGSDINIDGVLGSFSSDTDGVDDPNSQSSLETFSSQISDSEGPCFWSNELNPMSIAPFSEETGPIYDLMSNDIILRYFILIVSEDFFERFFIETNRYAAQELEIRGHRDVDWFDTSPQEINILTCTS
uniref:PiggyBac transposable element-derived protein domain-containing protein n=1 Tax=Magallana gigas TaxID=29159 RepID=K1QTJ1_MAGGI